MHIRCLLMLLAAATVATGSIASDEPLPADDATPAAAPAPAPEPALRPPPPAEAWTSSTLGLFPGASGVALRPPAAERSGELELPLGLNYNRGTRSLLMPIDEKNEWGVGIKLNVNASRPVELAPATTPLGLRPKRTPGVTLQKKF